MLKVNDSIHVQILTFEKTWKKSLTHSNINVKFQVVTHVLINYGKCNMQPMNNSFNMLKVDGSTHVPC